MIGTCRGLQRTHSFLDLLIPNTTTTCSPENSTSFAMVCHNMGTLQASKASSRAPAIWWHMGQSKQTTLDVWRVGQMANGCNCPRPSPAAAALSHQAFNHYKWNKASKCSWFRIVSMQRIELKSIPNTTTTCSHPTAKVADHPKKGRQEQQCPIKECPCVATVEKNSWAAFVSSKANGLTRLPTHCGRRHNAAKARKLHWCCNRNQ